MEFERENVRFPSGTTDCAAWLYRPVGVAKPPVVVMCHGLGGTRETRLDAYAERFAEAGLAVLPFTYRGFGDSGGSPRQVLDIHMQLDDIAAALTYARGREDLDGTRVGLWGTSFGGGHVLVAASRDRDVKVVVSQCPFTDGRASSGTLGAVSTLKVAVSALADSVAATLALPPVYVRLSGRRGDAALMTAPDVVAGYERLISGGPFNNDVAARAGLQIARYRPGQSMAQTGCPVLMCVCEQDSVAPAQAALRYAKGAPNVEVKRFPIGHFDIYFDEAFDQASNAQRDFLVKHLATQ